MKENRVGENKFKECINAIRIVAILLFLVFHTACSPQGEVGPEEEHTSTPTQALAITEDTATIKNGSIMEKEKKLDVENDKSIPTGEPDTRVEVTPKPLDDMILTTPKIIVKKSERSLELWEGDTLYGRFPIGLGWDPVGHKQKEGDGRTPEGTYYVCTRNSTSRFYLSLGVSYPNKEDAKAALEAGLIEQNTYELIEEAIDNLQQPPWKTELGGEIMMHGMGADSDWTAGCIAVDNHIMDVLWKQCPIGTPISIEP